MKLKTWAAVAAAATGVVVGGAARAQTYDFTGICTDPGCSGVSGQLVLSGYTPGQALTPEEFVSFTYSSSIIGPITISTDGNPSYNFDLAGGLGTKTGPYDVSFSGKSFAFEGLNTQSKSASPTRADIVPVSTEYAFQSQLDGDWSFTENGVTFDQGTDGVWTLDDGAVAAAPEPETWALLLVGVAGVGGAARLARRRRVAAAA